MNVFKRQNVKLEKLSKMILRVLPSLSILTKECYNIMEGKINVRHAHRHCFRV